MGDKLLLTGQKEEMLDLLILLEEIKVTEKKVYEQIQKLIVVEIIKALNKVPTVVAKHELKFKKSERKECTLTMRKTFSFC